MTLQESGPRFTLVDDLWRAESFVLVDDLWRAKPFVLVDDLSVELSPCPEVVVPPTSVVVATPVVVVATPAPIVVPPASAVLSTARVKVAEPSGVVPRNYDRLFRDFGKFIANEIRRVNTVANNFDDAYGEVCLRIVQAQVIEKFHTWCEGTVPETVTGEQAAGLLGITFTAFAQRQQGYHKGFSNKRGYYGKKCGIIYRNKTAIPMPLPIQGGHYGKKSIYRTSDILPLDCPEMKWGKQGERIVPSIKVEPTSFQWLNYLGRAVRNHFNNFCRTLHRRWKDRGGDLVGGGGESDPQFYTAEGRYNDRWEDTIRDDFAADRIEAEIDVVRTLGRLGEHGVQGDVREGVLAYLERGYTMSEAIERSDGLSKAQKRACQRICPL